MNELSLYSGAGGGLLASYLLGWRTVGYVEFNEYCQQVIAQRIADGVLPTAPIFGDVREFVQSGAAKEYRGLTDVVSGGFPCQPFSVAGRRKGSEDTRNMWPTTLEIVREVRPRFCFLENVPGLLSSGYFGKILEDLVESGYDCRWRILSAAEVGAPHQRKRLWIVAYTKHYGQLASQIERGTSSRGNSDSARKETSGESSRCGEQHGELADSQRPQDNSQWGYSQCRRLCLGRDTEAAQQDYGQADSNSPGGCCKVENPTGKGLEGASRKCIQGEIPRSSFPGRDNSLQWWEAEPDVGRVANGVAARVDRLKAIGNGQVPLVAAKAWEILTEGLL